MISIKYLKRKRKKFAYSSFYKRLRRKRNKIYSPKICFSLKILSIILYIIAIIILIKKQNGIKNLLFFEKSYSNEQVNNIVIISKPYLTKILKQKINETYEQNEFVNINEIESYISGGRKWIKNNNKTKEINVGAGLDPKFVLQGMFTLASVMDSQNLNIKLRLHIAVVEGFSVEEMLKIYSLREKIREDVEFNFYNAKRLETELKNFHKRGYGICGKLILPELLKDDVERLIIIDPGDSLVLRDLSEMYNWNMKNKTFCGVADIGVNRFGYISRKRLEVYINTGSYLIDVKKAKEDKIYEKIVKKKRVYRAFSFIGQHVFNDVSYGKIGYLPVRFGLIGPYDYDKKSDSPPFITNYKYIGRLKNRDEYNFLPKNIDEMNAQAFNPVIIHQWNGKWYKGRGLTIYRRIAQYYIKLAGIWDEICQIHPGYCKK